MISLTTKQMREITEVMEAIEKAIGLTNDIEIQVIPLSFKGEEVGQIEILDTTVLFYPLTESK